MQGVCGATPCVKLWFSFYDTLPHGPGLLGSGMADAAVFFSLILAHPVQYLRTWWLVACVYRPLSSSQAIGFISLSGRRQRLNFVLLRTWSVDILLVLLYCLCAEFRGNRFSTPRAFECHVEVIGYCKGDTTSPLDLDFYKIVFCFVLRCCVGSWQLYACRL